MNIKIIKFKLLIKNFEIMRFSLKLFILCSLCIGMVEKRIKMLIKFVFNLIQNNLIFLERKFE